MRLNPLSSIVFFSIALLAPASAQADTTLSSLVTGDYSGKADSLTTVLISNFMDQSKGIFWSTPNNVKNEQYIYWQQAHAMDVVLYSYERIKNTDTKLAAQYRLYMSRWYVNHANNWNHDASDATGFLNPFTDDMCWICLTLVHMSEVTGARIYANAAKNVFYKYIVTRALDDGTNFALPWKSDDTNYNACTNSPGCLLAAKLYELYGTESYLDVAKKLYTYTVGNILLSDGRVGEPPLSYTQGTFGEACRRLYHITGEAAYLSMAQKVIYYAITSTRCVDNGILRHEGTSMDQSLFKAVLIPYAVNLALDESASLMYRRKIVTFLQKNADTLWANLDKETYPKMYCPYYWGDTYDTTVTASMGAMTSGASLMENVARMNKALNTDVSGISLISNPVSAPEAVYTVSGRKVRSAGKGTAGLPKGVYVVGRRKVVVK
jgi:predicted alpha-1,6-mannanase (GH76 family)